MADMAGGGYNPQADSNKDGKVSKKEQDKYDRQKPGKSADKAVDPVKLARDYAWLINLAATDPSIAKMLRDLEAYLPTVQGDKTSIETWVSNRLPQTDWAKKRTSYRQQAELEQNDPRYAADWERSMQDRRDAISQAAASKGVTLDPAELEDLALQARYENWDATNIDTQLRPYLAADLAAGDDLRGNAGAYQTDLLQWARANGLNLGSAASAYVERLVNGEQTMDDVKQEIRQTYMAGAFPAWADKINAGMDISVLAAPYKGAMSDILEMDVNDINWDDPLLSAGLQSVTQDGKPVMMPLFEYKNMIRKDPRWQKTDNAYQVYANTAQDILRTWGLA